MKKLTKDEERHIIYEATSIAKEIWPACQTKFELKQGGYTAKAYAASNRIVLRIDVWLNMALVAKRLLICHELIHIMGLHHRNDKMYGAHFTDLLSMSMYKTIWGIDDILREISVLDEVSFDLLKGREVK